MNTANNLHVHEFEVTSNPARVNQLIAAVCVSVAAFMLAGTANLLAPKAVSVTLSSVWHWMGDGIEIERAVNNCMSTGLLPHARVLSK